MTSENDQNKKFVVRYWQAVEQSNAEQRDIDDQENHVLQERAANLSIILFFAAKLSP